MRKPSYTRQFEKDLRRVQKRGKDVQKLKPVMSRLIEEEVLEEKYRDHALIGSYKGRRECHIEPDWLLVYKLQDDEIIFERTGTHSDLFR
jgi:mRNA interferase YafQ